MKSDSLDLCVIVRTHGRPPIFLNRALRSIARQTRLPASVIIIDDGTDPACVNTELAKLDLSGLVVRHLARDIQCHPKPNRAAALNRGIAAATTRWISFLDDDDTWAPTFVERVATALQSMEAMPNFGGVVTQTEAVYEKLEGGMLIETGREPFNPNLYVVDVAALAVETQFTNNSMVIKKEVFDAVGFYREDLPVQEDWEFNVRAATQFHFEVIPEPLVRYHQRPSNSSAANTSADELNRVAVLIRNEWLRKDLTAGRIGLGQLSLAGESRGLGRELSRWIRWRRRIAKWLGRPIR
jgi:glycosyltransferase involved in cell wall biosynthesis